MPRCRDSSPDQLPQHQSTRVSLPSVQKCTGPSGHLSCHKRGSPLMLPHSGPGSGSGSGLVGSQLAGCMRCGWHRPERQGSTMQVQLDRSMPRSMPKTSVPCQLPPGCWHSSRSGLTRFVHGVLCNERQYAGPGSAFVNVRLCCVQNRLDKPRLSQVSITTAASQPSRLHPN